MQTFHLFCTKKAIFSILHTYFYKTSTSIHLLYIIFYINNIFIFFFLILFYLPFLFPILPLLSSSFFFLISLPFPLSFLPLLSSSFSHGQNPDTPENSINTTAITSTTTPLQSTDLHLYTHQQEQLVLLYSTSF